MSYNNQTEKQKAKSIERWTKAVKIDKLFKTGLSRKQIAEQLNMRVDYVNLTIAESWIDDVPKDFKNA